MMSLPAIEGLAFGALDRARVGEDAEEVAVARAPDIATLNGGASRHRAIADLGGAGPEVGAVEFAVAPGVDPANAILRAAASGEAVVAAQTFAALGRETPEFTVLRRAGRLAGVIDTDTRWFTPNDVHAVEIAVGTIGAIAAGLLATDRRRAVAAPRRGSLSRKHEQSTHHPNHRAHQT